MSDETQQVRWQKTGKMPELYKYVRLLPSDKVKVEVGLHTCLVKGAHTRILVEIQREIGTKVYFFSKIYHPKELLDQGQTLLDFKRDAGEYFDQMRRKENAGAH